MIPPCCIRPDDAAAGYAAGSQAGQGPPDEFPTSIAAARQGFQILLEITTELGSSLCVDDTLFLLARPRNTLRPQPSPTAPT